MKKKVLGLVASVVLSAQLIMPSSVVQAAQTIYNNATGVHGGYNYELWKDNGTTSMTLTDGGTFSCSWSNINNALFRKGKKWDCTQTWQQLGNISVDYACNYQPNGNSYLCVYGWTRSPLVEYYIVDSWGTWRPPGSSSKGQITVDGGTYDVYETTRVNQPSIDGNTTFQQYWSVRTTKRTSGTISVSEHFKAWERMGLKMGKMYEAALTVEGYQSSGQATVTKNNISFGGSVPSSQPQESVQPTPSQAAPSTAPSVQPSQSTGSTTGLPSGVTCTYSVTSDWGSGYQGQIVLKNGSSQTLNAWQLAFNYSNKITSLWGAELAGQTGNQVVVKAPSWDQNLAPGQSVAINFVAEGSSSVVPSGYSLK